MTVQKSDADDGCAGNALLARECDSILASGEFQVSPRNRRFLEFIVRETIEGRADRIKAYTIATRVFDRDERFDPQLDSIVRIEAGRLRRAIERYYLTEGASSQWRLVVPKGTYVPRIEKACTAQPAAAVYHGTPGNDLPSVLVEDFASPGEGDAAAARICNGFASDLAIWLSRFPSIRVRHALVRPPRADMPDESSGQLRVVGSVWTSHDRAFVRAELMDVETGNLVWGERLEAPLDTSDVFAAQSDLSSRLAATLAQTYGVIHQANLRKVIANPALPVTAYHAILVYYDYARGYDASKILDCQRALEAAAHAETGNAEVQCCLSRLYVDRYRFRFDGDKPRKDYLELARKAAHRAIALEPMSASSHAALGLVLWFEGNVRSALDELETAHRLNPNDAGVLAELAIRFATLMEWEKAQDCIDQALHLNPGLSSAFRVAEFLGEYWAGHYEQALAVAQRVEAPHTIYPHVCVAAAAGRLGAMDAARRAVAEILAIDPEYGSHFIDDMNARNMRPELVRAIAEGLRAAGLPGTPTFPRLRAVPLVG